MIALDIILFVVLIAIGVILDTFFGIPLRTQSWVVSIAILILLVRVLREQRALFVSETETRSAGDLFAQLGRIENSLNTILRKEEAIMGQEDDLLAAVKAAADEEASLETRVDGLIAALKQPHDSPIVAQAIADLEALKSREAGFDAPPPPAP